MAPLQDSGILKSTSSLSRSNTTFDTGRSTMLFLPARSTLSIFNLTLRTNPFSSKYVFMTLHRSQSFLMVLASCKITISPTFKFLLFYVHFFFSLSDCKNSFLQRHQNSFTMFWTHLHLLRLYKSGLEKSPGGGRNRFDFMVKRFDGERGKLLAESLMLLVVKGPEFKIPSVSAISVTTDSSSSDLPYVCIREDRRDKLNGSDVAKHHPFCWHKEDSFSNNPITTWCLHKKLKFLLVHCL